MELDPELLKHLRNTFRIQQEEQSQVVINGLLQLEKGLSDESRMEVLREMFRAVHNIKGAARGIGIQATADIAHRLESLFSGLKQADGCPAGEVIDISLKALDRMRDATDASNGARELTFNLAEFLGEIEQVMAGGQPRTRSRGDASEVQDVPPYQTGGWMRLPSLREPRRRQGWRFSRRHMERRRISCASPWTSWTRSLRWLRNCR